MDKRGGFLSFLGGIFLSLIIFGIVFEVVLLGISYFYADKVKCNLIWCEFIFKDKINYQDNNSIKIQGSWNENFTGVTYNNTDTGVYCYQNHSEINCYQRGYFIKNTS